jgi:hypothetical protein
MSGSPVKISTVRQINYNEGMPSDLIPVTGYQENIGSPFKKWLSLYAGELNVETLVSQDTIATIGGRILVGPSTTFAFDTGSEIIVNNPSFEIAGGGGGDVFDSWNEYYFSGSIQRLPLGDGTYYCGITTGSSVIVLTHIEQNISIYPSGSFTISCLTKGSGSSTGNWFVYDPVNTNYIFYATTGISTASWTSISRNFTSPSNCNSITIGFAGSGSTIGQFVGFDNISLIQTGRDPNIIYTKHNEMSGSDIVYAEARSHVEFMQIVSGPSGSGPYQYTVIRNLDGSGSNVWYAGDALFNTGIVNDGFIDLYSAHGIKSASQLGPSIAGNVRNSLIYNDWGTKWAVGNLNGLYDYSNTAWGAAFGGYGSGSANITIDNINGLRLRNYNQTVIQLDNSGSALISGKLSMPGINGAIAIGAIPPSGSATGTGIWIDRNGLYGTNSNIPQAYIGSDGRFYAGLGNIKISSGGISIDDVVTDVRLIQWNYNSGSGLLGVGHVFGDYGGGSDAVMWLRSLRDASSPWSITRVVINAFDNEHSKDARLNITASGSGTVLDTTGFDKLAFAADSGSVIVGNANPTGILQTRPVGNTLALVLSNPTSNPVFQFSDETHANYIGMSKTTGNLLFGTTLDYSTDTAQLIIDTVGNVYSVPWTDYGTSANLLGFSSTTEKLIQYKKIGKTVLVTFAIAGTSNSGSISFTLPYSSNSIMNYFIPVVAMDNAVPASGAMILMLASGSFVRGYKDINGTGWTTSGTKIIRGQFFYEST